jgi:plastocyanin
LLAAFVLIMSGSAALRAQSVDVSATVEWNHKAPVTSKPQAVVWLTPLTPVAAPVAPGHFRMTQKDKMFHPHLLVVPVGSTVEFPNLDPFFHNVFSLFNGKRFDLGLYEAGSSRDVHFNHEGVSFLFCNIHPEMSAVIVALSTPYYGVAQQDGTVFLHSVPQGSYRLSVWAEGVDASELESLSRVVEVAPAHDKLGTLRISSRYTTAGHKNKFGEDYQQSPTTLY